MDLEEIKKNYRNFDDDKLMKLATEINSLRKEVIPILEAELKKRNLSLLDKSKYSKEQFDNPFAKEKLFYSDEYIEYFKFDKKNSTNKFKKKYFIKNSLSILIAMLFSIIGGYILFKTLMLISGIRLVLFVIISLFIIKLIFTKLNVGKIAEIQFDKVILAKYPIGNFNIFRILVLIQIAVNSLKKIEIPFNEISKIYQKNDLTNKGFYIEILENNSKKKNYRIFLEALSENDRKELLEVIRIKIMEIKNTANNQ